MSPAPITDLLSSCFLLLFLPLALSGGLLCRHMLLLHHIHPHRWLGRWSALGLKAPCLELGCLGLNSAFESYHYQLLRFTTVDSLLSLLSLLEYETGMYWTRNKPFRVVVKTDELMRVRQLDSAWCMAGAPGSGPLLGALPPLLPSAFTRMLVSWLHLLVSHPVPASQASLLCLELPLQGVCTLPHTATC